MAAIQHGLFGDEFQTVFPDAGVEKNTETFRIEDDLIIRSVTTRGGNVCESTINRIEDTESRDLREQFDLAWLRSQTKPADESSRGKVRVADLFSGCGGMSVGIDEACRSLEFEAEHVFAADIEPQALSVYTRNFRSLHTWPNPIEQAIDSSLHSSLSKAERELKKKIGRIDLVVGGPPCQGHSDLNNHTRREDPKNLLYERMARFAEVVGPEHIVIENVPGVRHDRNGVFDRTCQALSDLGYRIDALKVPAESLGVPQRRHRAVVVASLSAPIEEGFLKGVVTRFKTPERSFGWACSDLVDLQSGHPIDAITSQSKVSQERIDWLFEHGVYNLPDDLRPDCHRTKKHTYKSVYGRLYWDRPAWTITTGFPVMGQGRFIHPTRRRSITPHEAARLQFFPDFFDFGLCNRKGYAHMIGNAVPSKLSYVLALELLR